MNLPEILQQQLDQAEQAMLEHPRHELLPFYRLNIYKTIRSFGDTFASTMRARLALSVAYHVLPIWESARPHNPTPQHLLKAAENVLEGNISKEAAYTLANRDYFTDTFDYANYDPIGNAHEALIAAAGALNETLGFYALDPLLDIDEQTSDRELDPWSYDTAAWGVEAVAGRTKAADSDPIQRRAFWLWWLWEAIPEAYRAASTEVSKP
jgi:hypothetical protein